MDICTINQLEKLQPDAHVESQGLQSPSTHWIALAHFSIVQEKICPDSDLIKKSVSYIQPLHDRIHLSVILNPSLFLSPRIYCFTNSSCCCLLPISQIHPLVSILSASVSVPHHFTPGHLKHLPIWFTCPLQTIPFIARSKYLKYKSCPVILLHDTFTVQHLSLE